MIEKTSDTTRLIDGLEKKGFVERIRTSKDRRLSLTKITSDGMKKLEDIDPLFMDLLKTISAVLSEDECKQLSSLCKKLYSSS
jgi:DNA-binding MarR family transcriptional regulator